ncbi:hypothetical protein ACE1B6_21360 [Aerosakkonemataceae cyanobacterium BLCC-F154]|uniref:Uncharacterized protein n=1 Tax=Floridaenema fluviatile BLCC-F154 TaxID=3153640 RepID=A0ABV4YG52_9CYAN
MKYKLVICIALFAFVISACGSAPEGSLIREEDSTSVPQGTALRDDDKNQFQEALNQAKNATNLAKSAKSEIEWKAVANQWNKAIELMKLVPKTDPNYQASQQKILEYQKSLVEVDKKLKR